MVIAVVVMASLTLLIQNVNVVAHLGATWRCTRRLFRIFFQPKPSLFLYFTRYFNRDTNTDLY